MEINVKTESDPLEIIHDIKIEPDEPQEMDSFLLTSNAEPNEIIQDVKVEPDEPAEIIPYLPVASKAPRALQRKRKRTIMDEIMENTSPVKVTYLKDSEIQQQLCENSKTNEPSSSKPTKSSTKNAQRGKKAPKKLKVKEEMEEFVTYTKFESIPQSDDSIDSKNIHLFDDNSQSTTQHLNSSSDDDSSSSYETDCSDEPSFSDGTDSDHAMDNGMHCCIKCNKKFKRFKNYKAHECVICEICNKKFLARSSLKRHIENVHNESVRYECKDCNKVFKGEMYLKSHLKAHDKIFKCEDCGRVYGSVGQLNEHRIRHLNPEMLVCKVCGLKLCSRASLKFHMRRHDADRVKHIKCDECDFATDLNSTLVKHKKKHLKMQERFKTMTEWVKCEKCQAVLKNENSLARHIYYSHSLMKHPCSLCDARLKSKVTLKLHYKNIHGLVMKKTKKKKEKKPKKNK